MKKFKFLAPYKPDGKTQFPETQNRTGIYLIKENGKLVYIGYSAKNLYRTLYRHFEHWNHKFQKVITYKTRLRRHKYTVRVVLCTPAQAVRLERALIIKHKPRDNEAKYETYTMQKWDKQVLDLYNDTTVEKAPF